MGKEGEALAQRMLRDKGFAILERNWRFRKLEIDIIAANTKEIVFAEVKTRKNSNFGEPETFVSSRQQQSLIKAAHQYLIENNIDLEARFDVIAITENNNMLTVKHFEGAFYPKPK